ncbi:hypothetical protein BgiMline_011846 [Biomphalaria glabrata]|uniref:Uncharacterized protein LOC106074532 n=1 Tax=Biomphalaria glabrata TaxID=6526 RepID=A0A9W3A9S3_BIOGL|nr:uncharacterized protein LOC106074532 [Biomphalaria glabrata]KAI8728699.1 hypothetical protein BgiMline_032591 [Biomphalaria glabrata]
MASTSSCYNEQSTSSSTSSTAASTTPSRSQNSDKQEVIDVEEEAEDDCMVVKIDLSKCHLSYGKIINNLELVIDDSDDDDDDDDDDDGKNSDKYNSSLLTSTIDKQHPPTANDSSVDIDDTMNAVIKVEQTTDLNTDEQEENSCDMNADSPELSNDSTNTQTFHAQASNLSENSVPNQPATEMSKQTACKLCSKLFHTRSALVYHMIEDHKEVSKIRAKNLQQNNPNENDSILKSSLQEKVTSPAKTKTVEAGSALVSVNPLNSRTHCTVNPPVNYPSIITTLPTTQSVATSLPENQSALAVLPSTECSTPNLLINQTGNVSLPSNLFVPAQVTGYPQRMPVCLVTNQTFPFNAPNLQSAAFLPTQYVNVTRPKKKFTPLVLATRTVGSTTKYKSSSGTTPPKLPSPALRSLLKMPNNFSNANNDSITPVIVSVSTITDPLTPFHPSNNNVVTPLNTPLSHINDSVTSANAPTCTIKETDRPVYTLHTSINSLLPLTVPSTIKMSTVNRSATTITNSVTPVSQSAISVTPVSQSAISVTPVSQSAISVTPVSQSAISVTPVSQSAISVTPVSAVTTVDSNKVNLPQTYCVCCECCRQWFPNYSCLREHLKTEMKCKNFHDELFKPKGNLKQPQPKSAFSKKPNISCLSCKRKFATDAMLSLHLHQNAQCRNVNKTSDKSERNSSTKKNTSVTTKESSPIIKSIPIPHIDAQPAAITIIDVSGNSEPMATKDKTSCVQNQEMMDAQPSSQQDISPIEKLQKTQCRPQTCDLTSEKTSSKIRSFNGGNLKANPKVTHANNELQLTSKPETVNIPDAALAIDTVVQLNDIKEAASPYQSKSKKESDCLPLSVDDSDSSSLEEGSEESASSSDEDAVVEYKCKHCSASFTHRSDLRKHLKTHNKGPAGCATTKRKILCKVCKKKFKDNTGLQAHLLQRRFCFLHVTRAFRDSCEQGSHVCQMCKKSLTSALDLSKHCYKTLTCRLRYIDLVLQNIKKHEQTLSNIPALSQNTNTPSLLHEKVDNTQEISKSLGMVSQVKYYPVAPVVNSPVIEDTVSSASNTSPTNGINQVNIFPAISSSVTMNPSDVALASFTNPTNNSINENSNLRKCLCCKVEYTHFLKHILTNKNCLYFYVSHPKERPSKVPFCFDCRRKFDSLELCSKHKCVTLSIECLKCGLRFTSDSRLKMHSRHCPVLLASKAVPKSGNDAKVLSDSPSPSCTSFSCLICSAQFATLKLLMDHSQQHTEEHPFVCHRCNTTFYHYNRFVSHQAYHIRMDKEAGVSNTDPLIKGNPLTTAIVPLKDNTSNSANDRVADDGTGTKQIYECFICPQVFYDFSAHKSHIEAHSRSSYSSCNICFENFPSDEALQQHSKQHEISKTSRTHVNNSNKCAPVQVKAEAPVPVSTMNCLYCHLVLTSPRDKQDHLSQSVSCKSIMSCILEKHFFIHPSIDQGQLNSFTFKPNQCQFCFESFFDVISHIIETPCLTLLEAGVLKYRSSFSSFNESNSEKMSSENHHLTKRKFPLPAPAPEISLEYSKEEHLYCFSCRKYFTTAYSVIQHNSYLHHRLISRRIHLKMGKDGNNFCKICRKSFGETHRRKFIDHMFQIHNEGSSRLLNFVDKGSSNVPGAPKKSSNSRYCCSLCDMVLSCSAKVSHLKAHVNSFMAKLNHKSARPMKSFSVEKCPICRNVLHSRFSMRQHLLRHRAQDIFKPLSQGSRCNSLKLSACPQCKRWFKTVDSMNYHIQKVHKREKTFSSEDSTAYKTSELSNGVQANDSQSRSPELTESKSLIYLCKLCYKTFENKTGLWKHLKRNHQLVNKDDLNRFVNHQVNRSDELYKSPCKDVAFSECSNIDTNRAECRAGFSLRPICSASMNCHICQDTLVVQEYQSHLKTVHKWPLEKLFDCSYCNMRFPFQNLLPDHLEQCKNNCLCLICHRQTLSVRGLQSHLNQKHNLSLVSYVSAHFSSSLIKIVNDGLKIVTAENESTDDDNGQVRVCLLCRSEFLLLSEYREHLERHIRHCWIRLEDCTGMLVSQINNAKIDSESCLDTSHNSSSSTQQKSCKVSESEELTKIKSEIDTEQDCFSETVSEKDLSMPNLVIVDDETTGNDWNMPSVHVSDSLLSPDAPTLLPEKSVDHHYNCSQSMRKIKTEVNDLTHVHSTVQETDVQSSSSSESVVSSLVSSEPVDSNLVSSDSSPTSSDSVISSLTSSQPVDSNLISSEPVISSLISSQPVDSNLISSEPVDSSPKSSESDISSLIISEPGHHNETILASHSSVSCELQAIDAQNREDVVLLLQDHSSQAASDDEWMGMNRKVKEETDLPFEDEETIAAETEGASNLLSTTDYSIIIDLGSSSDTSDVSGDQCETTLAIVTDTDGPAFVSHRKRSSGDENSEEIPEAKRSKLDISFTHDNNEENDVPVLSMSVNQSKLPSNSSELDRNLFKVFSEKHQ